MDDEARRRRGDKRRDEHVGSSGREREHRRHKHRDKERRGDEDRDDESDEVRDSSARHRSRREKSKHRQDDQESDEQEKRNHRSRDERARSRHRDEDSDDEHRSRRGRDRRARSRYGDEESDEEYRSRRARSRHGDEDSDEERRSRRARSRHGDEGDDKGKYEEENEDEQRSHRKSRRKERHHRDRKRPKHGDGASDDERESKRRKSEEDGKDVKDVEMQEQNETVQDKEAAADGGSEEQRKLDEQVDRILEEQREKWKKAAQEQRRKKDEEEREMEQRQLENGKQQPENAKKWTLEDESDGEDEQQPAAAAAGEDTAQSEEKTEVDPLDAYMSSMVLPEVEKLAEQDSKVDGPLQRSKVAEEPDSEEDYSEPGEDDIDDFMEQMKQTKAEKLQAVDHSQINYPPFRKDFYIEVKEITRMTAEEVAAYRKELELTTRGKDIPKPIKTWNQAGLSNRILEVIKKCGFEKPMPIQAQALPVIMSGRDCIGIAKTGSGKTLAFVLPMLRHIMNQTPLQPGDGPIALIMAPTRELVQQIHSDVKKFARVLGFTSIPVYGGSGVEQQINCLKRGGEVVVCTPGRMIDILCASSGKITNLRRVTYLVMDEADRMFDLGFEPQITRIVQNTRPDRQTVLFSATFPVYVEVLAKKVLHKPVDIHMGGRSIVNKDILQMVEVRPDDLRFMRLLELLGEWSQKGKILVFVNSQEKCDSLFKDLIKAGYACLSLHGGKDQNDRESTISDFRSNVCNLLIATSVAARGLDVQDLELVVNFDVPNHYEEYVHRVGRTGRAGRKGTAVTFIYEGEEKYAPDLVKALKSSEQVVPDDLREMAEAFWKKVDQKTEQKHPSGYGGRGHKFNAEEEEARKAAKKAQAKEYGYEDDDHDDEPVIDEDAVKKKAVAAAAAELPAAAAAIVGAARAAAIAAALTKAATGSERHEAAVEINDFSQHARHQVTRKEALERINEITGASVTIKGKYVAPGKTPAPGERKLFLLIEGQTEVAVKRAKLEIMDILKESRANGPALPAAPLGKYHVL